ncbi:MAG: N-acetylmuramoyl-L-alanine amidase [Bacilli bacterium]|nr:N-acetylmuramoyl-L-alanine amidase [Bacilli bacterium]
MKILLSAGHGGTDSGSIGADKGKEKNRTIDLANRVAKYLKSAGHSVTVKQEKNLLGKWSMSNRRGYDYALSVHFNAFNGSAKGTEVLYKNTPKKATTMANKVAKAIGTTNRGAKNRTDLYMLNIGFDNLVEVCFHDNSNDLSKYNANIDNIAKAITDSITGGSTTSTVSKPSSKPTCTGDITYQTYDNKKKQWLPEVVNDRDYAGNLGNGLGGVRAKCKNGNIYIQTHVKGGSWLSTINSSAYSKNSNDGNSYSGIINKPIDGVKIWSDYGYVEYRVHLKGGKWLPWVKKADNTASGYAGIYGKEIDAIQMK